jgi:hypothetical protein
MPVADFAIEVQLPSIRVCRQLRDLAVVANEELLQGRNGPDSMRVPCTQTLNNNTLAALEAPLDFRQEGRRSQSTPIGEIDPFRPILFV